MKRKDIMRALYKGLVPAVALLVVLMLNISSCKNDDTSGDVPVVSKVRVTEKDSTITEGSWGQVVAIVGEKMADIREIYFNDVPAVLNPNYITPTSIVCSIPSKVPGTITDNIVLVNSQGVKTTVPFTVKLPAPTVIGLYNEMAAPGTDTYLIGSNFYFVSSIKFGDKEATIKSVQSDKILLTIPSNAEDGSKITVVAQGGTVVTGFAYRDKGKWLMNFDDNATPWGSKFCWGNLPFRTDGESISGAYGYIEGTDISPTGGYTDKWLASTCYFDYGYSISDYSDKYLQFEINVQVPWAYSDSYTASEHAMLKIIIHPDGPNTVTFEYAPQTTLEYKSTGFFTNGWMTVRLPLYGTTPPTSIHDFRILYVTNKQTVASAKTYIDNFRICSR